MPPTPVPVTVMGYVPGTVLDPTVIVMVELPEPGAGIELGLKITVVPEGAPEADRAIALLKPPLMAVVMVDVPSLPCATGREAGEAEIVKLDRLVTTSLTVTFCWMPGLVPVTVMGYVPGTVLDPTVIVMVELPAPGAGIGLGLKITVVPEGAPEADRVIALLKPPLMAVVMVDVPSLPCATGREVGEAEIVKVGGEVTVSVTVTFCWMPGLVPVTVMGYVAGTVLDPTVIVMVELPAPGAGIGLGLKITVVPEGAPEADRAIALLKPPVMAVVMVEVP
jgi:hypothetical protein